MSADAFHSQYRLSMGETTTCVKSSDMLEIDCETCSNAAGGLSEEGQLQLSFLFLIVDMMQ